MKIPCKILLRIQICLNACLPASSPCTSKNNLKRATQPSIVLHKQKQFITVIYEVKETKGDYKVYVGVVHSHSNAN